MDCLPWLRNMNITDVRIIRKHKLPYSGYFSEGEISVDTGNFSGSWKTFRGYMYVCTNGRGSLHLW